MSDNTSVVLCGAMLLVFLLGLGTCVHSCEKRKDANEAERQRREADTALARERALAVSRDRCIAAGDAWFDGSCIPRCVK